jgi:hypothetical protein
MTPCGNFRALVSADPCHQTFGFKPQTEESDLVSIAPNMPKFSISTGAKNGMQIHPDANMTKFGD